MNALVKYEAACSALAAAKSVDEVKDVRDKAEALRLYARQAKNKQLEIDASEIRFRAERRIGELMAAQREHFGTAQGRRSDLGLNSTQVEKPTLADAGIDKNLADRARKYAAVPEQEFEEILADRRERIETENKRVTAVFGDDKEVLDEAKEIRGKRSKKKRADRDERLVNLANLNAPLPTNRRYPVIYADPPWRYDFSPSDDRSVENHYPT